MTMLNNARTKVFLCDAGKFNSTSGFKVCSLKEIDYIVTDSPISEEILNMYNFTVTKSTDAFIYKK